jgi:hypothetical protein
MVSRRERTREARTLRAVLAALAATLLAAGCASVPDGGPAHAVRQVPPGTFEEDIGVRSQPNLPQPDDSPANIVRGYLAAGKSSTDRHGIARDFLTPQASARWDDATAVRVISVNQVTPDKTGHRVLLTGRYLGSVDRTDGSYRVDGRVLRITFRLEQVDGQWRIDNPPQGVLLPQSDFAQVYRPVDLYFLAPDGHTVVPDRRYLDVTQAALSTTMVNLLLSGPSRWLAPGVRTAFPQGTQTRSNVVSDGDVLVVDLTQQAAAASPQARSQMAAQLTWTLSGFGAKAIRLLIEGRPLPVRHGSDVLPRNGYRSFDPSQLSSRAAGFYLDRRGVLRTLNRAAVIGPHNRPENGLRSAALSPDLSQIAGVRAAPGGGEELTVGPVRGQQPPRYTAGTLTQPSWGAGSDAVFVVADGDRVLTVLPDGSVRHVAADGLTAHGAVRALRVSRDGVRVAVVAGSGAHSALLVGVLHEKGSKWSITGLRAIAGDLSDVRDVAWADASSLLVLARSGTAGDLPWQVDVDGATETAGSVSGLPSAPTEVAAAPDHPDLVAAGGRIFQRAGSSWAPAGSAGPLTGTAPFYPG